MLGRKLEKTLGPIPGMHPSNSLFDVLESRGYLIMAINRHLLRATSPVHGPSIYHSNGNNRLCGNNTPLPVIGSNASGSKHHHPLAHVLNQTDRPSPTTRRVSFVILFITIYHLLGVFIVENLVILRKIAHTNLQYTTQPPPTIHLLT